jgi:hypothetical protein
MRFRILEGQEPRPVELVFGQESDLTLLREWRLPARLQHHEPARDAVEFARLASKRWRYHRQSGRIATHAAELRAAPGEELAFLLLARAGWNTRSPVLGLAHCRRTWCGHIYLDFLSVHPRIAARQEPVVKGVGAGILGGLCELAGQAGIPVVWGETTASSVAFYRRVLGHARLLDHLMIAGPLLEHCRREFARVEIA